MWPSSVRISPDKPEPQPTSRMNEGTSGLILEERYRDIRQLKQINRSKSLDMRFFSSSAGTISACTSCIRELEVSLHEFKESHFDVYFCASVSP